MDMKLNAVLRFFLLSFISAGFSGSVLAEMPVQANSNADVVATAGRAGYGSPDAAVAGLVAAMRSNDRHLLRRILGPQADRYIRSKDAAADNEARIKFLHAFDDKSRLESKGEGLAILHVGNEDWPLPYPLVKQGERWYFDAKAGEQEWLDRRIGQNELSAIQVALAYVDAQREYVLKDRNHDGLLEYAQRIVSSAGQHDGLYWPHAENEPVSPMGQAFAKASKAEPRPGKLESRPYHGYFFRILTAQGKSAPGGAMDYMVKGKLIGGFALIATPAKYGESGIKSFIVNHDGIVYSKDLGPLTASAGAAIGSFDPDSSWKKETR